MYTIRIAELNDKDKIISFIDNHWKKNHVFVKSDVLFDFQHYEEHERKYNFLIAEHTKTGEVDGIIGYIPTCHYDPSLADNGDYWGAIWKVRTDVQNDEIKMLGLLLWEELYCQKELKTFGAIGISDIAKQFYKVARLKTGVLNQYYILHEQDDPYKIVIAPNNKQSIKIMKTELIKKVDLSDDMIIKPAYRPYKSIKYLINRYLNHPIYRYEFWMLANQCLIVTRKINIYNQFAIRIVDCLGNLSGLPNLYSDFQAILESENAEYIDFLNYGIDGDVFVGLGFQKLDLTGAVIIPNYFEPYLQTNIGVEFAYKAPLNYVIFKGDADQDRPNLL